jgi:hypothetical protein
MKADLLREQERRITELDMNLSHANLRCDTDPKIRIQCEQTLADSRLVFNRL